MEQRVYYESIRFLKILILLHFLPVLCIERPIPHLPPSSSSSSSSSSQFTINYLIVVALVGEFCNKFILCLFFVICPQYGAQRQFITSSSLFGFTATAGLGLCSVAILIVFKWFVYRKEYGIPSIGSISGAIAGN